MTGLKPSSASKATGIEARCAATGMRMTEQRRVIARVLAESVDHPDVEELYRRCVAVDDKISISTVYRTVKLFEDAGIIERHDFREGRARYETMRDSHHDHLINLRDGKVIEFTSEEIEKLQAEIARKLGYKLVDHRLELYCVPLDDDKPDVLIGSADRSHHLRLRRRARGQRGDLLSRACRCADAARLSDHVGAGVRALPRRLRGRRAIWMVETGTRPQACPMALISRRTAGRRCNSTPAICSRPRRDPRHRSDVLAYRSCRVCVASSGSHQTRSITAWTCAGLYELPRAEHLFGQRRSQRGKPAPDLFLFAAERDERRAGALRRDRGQRGRQ